MNPNFVRDIAQSNLPFFDGSMLIWAGIFIALSIFFSVMTWRSRSGFSARSLMYWAMNAAVFVLGIFFFTKAFPRIGAGWTLAILCIVIFAISGATVATKSKSGGKDDKKDEKK